jgi:hypothetical protein
MTRVFVRHDRRGRILGVASVELMAEGLSQPFHLDDPAHGVVEVAADHEAFRDGLEHAADTHAVNVSAGTLVAKKRGGRAPVTRRNRKTPSR